MSEILSFWKVKVQLLILIDKIEGKAQEVIRWLQELPVDSDAMTLIIGPSPAFKSDHDKLYGCRQPEDNSKILG